DGKRLPMKVNHLAGVSRVTARGIDGVPGLTAVLRRQGTSHVPLLGRVVAGRYRIVAILGRGSTSIVCGASRLDRGEPVAVKVLSPVSPVLVDAAVADRFRFEAEALAGVRHPNVVSVIDYGTDDDGLGYTVMELLEGQTLAERLILRDRLAPHAAVRL